MFNVYIGHSPLEGDTGVHIPHQVKYSDCLHLVFKTINNNVLILINLYCNVLILIYLKNHLNIAGRLSLHKALSTLKQIKLEEF